MANHLYAVGSTVALEFRVGQTVPPGSFLVEAQLPPLATSLQYRIKSMSEGFSRVVVEQQLSLVGAKVDPAPVQVARPHRGEED